ncbi:YidB family protein [Klebsiella aerogenes]|uniref:YidB family protein n=1 Tax=Klebsiella aerogenes TaxID=548 RepID=UPI0037AE45BE
MSLFDRITGGLNEQVGKTEQYQAILSWIQQQGGINGLLDKFREQGFGTLVGSWLSSGPGLPVSASQIISVLGAPVINVLAEKLELDPQKTSSLVAEYLPGIVDALSPDGKIDDQHDLLSAGMSLLKGRLFG